MLMRRVEGRWPVWLLVVVVLASLAACAGPTASPAEPAAGTGELGAEVAALGTRVALLETQVAPTPTPPPAPTPTLIPAVAGVVTDGASRGEADAPVTITEYMDYLCGYCARHAMTTARLIDEKYVTTGEVRVVAKQMPVHGEAAVNAAEAALCASDQDAFWEYHDGLMESLYHGQPLAAQEDGLSQLATALDLDMAAFSSCLSEGKYAEQVEAEALEGQDAGVQGTPTFFVNDLQVVGAQPFEVFEAAIQQALAAE